MANRKYNSTNNHFGPDNEKSKFMPIYFIRMVCIQMDIVYFAKRWTHTHTRPFSIRWIQFWVDFMPNAFCDAKTIHSIPFQPNIQMNNIANINGMCICLWALTICEQTDASICDVALPGNSALFSFDSTYNGHCFSSCTHILWKTEAKKRRWEQIES